MHGNGCAKRRFVSANSALTLFITRSWAGGSNAPGSPRRSPIEIEAVPSDPDHPQAQGRSADHRLATRGVRSIARTLRIGSVEIDFGEVAGSSRNERRSASRRGSAKDRNARSNLPAFDVYCASIRNCVRNGCKEQRKSCWWTGADADTDCPSMTAPIGGMHVLNATSASPVTVSSSVDTRR